MLRCDLLGGACFPTALLSCSEILNLWRYEVYVRTAGLSFLSHGYIDLIINDTHLDILVIFFPPYPDKLNRDGQSTRWSNTLFKHTI